jgi:hypothetical protein
MGIEQFKKQLLQLFPKILVPLSEGARYQFDHVFLDLNGILHQLALKAETEEHLIIRIFKRLDRILNVRFFSASKTIHLFSYSPSKQGSGYRKNINRIIVLRSS